MKKFSLSFLIFSFTVSNFGFAGQPKEECAEHITRSLFQKEVYTEYEVLLATQFKPEVFLSTLQSYDLHFEGSADTQIKEAIEYFKADEKEEELLIFKREIMIDYLRNAYPEKVQYWLKDLVPEARERLKKNRDSSQEVEKEKVAPVKISEKVPAKTSEVKPVKKSEANPKKPLLPLDQIRQDALDLDDPTLRYCAKGLLNREWEPPYIREKLTKFFNTLNSIPFLPGMVNKVLPPDFVERLVNLNKPEAQGNSHRLDDANSEPKDPLSKKVKKDPDQDNRKN